MEQKQFRCERKKMKEKNDSISIVKIFLWWRTARFMSLEEEEKNHDPLIRYKKIRKVLIDILGINSAKSGGNQLIFFI